MSELNNLTTLSREVFQGDLPDYRADDRAVEAVTSENLAFYTSIAENLEAPAWLLTDGEQLKRAIVRQERHDIYGKTKFPPYRKLDAAKLYSEAGEAYAGHGFYLRAVTMKLKAADLHEANAKDAYLREKYPDWDWDKRPKQEGDSTDVATMYPLAGRHLLEAVVLGSKAAQAFRSALDNGHDARLPIRANYPDVMRYWPGHGEIKFGDIEARHEGNYSGIASIQGGVFSGRVALLNLTADYGTPEHRLLAYQAAETALGGCKTLAERRDEFRDHEIQRHISWYIEQQEATTSDI
jgi:hypothetical protein